MWKQLQALLRRAGIRCTLSVENLIFNNVHNDNEHVCNTVILISKQYIFRCKCQGVKPTFGGLKAEIRLNYKIEMWNSFVNANMKKVAKKWSPIVNILCDNNEN